MGKLDGRVALISGAGPGYGCLARSSASRRGARVVIGNVLDDEGNSLAAELGEAVRYVHLNVTEVDDWTRAVTTAVSEFGGWTSS